MCKGSTADSDSVCLGSNPGTAAKKPRFERAEAFLRGVAQFGRALRSGRRSRRFKSCHLDQFEYPVRVLDFFMSLRASHSRVGLEPTGLRVFLFALPKDARSFLWQSVLKNAVSSATFTTGEGCTFFPSFVQVRCFFRAQPGSRPATPLPA